MNLPGMPHLGTYRIIAADPPWEHNNYGQAVHGSYREHYPGMTIAQLGEMPVASLAHPEGALLLLWCTACQEADGAHRALAAAWGFQLRTRLLVWAKVYPKCATCTHAWDDHDPALVTEDVPGACACGCARFAPRAFRGPGSYSMQGCEALWVGVRGDFTWSGKRAARDVPELLLSPNPRNHSEKPERAYSRVDRLWPAQFGPKLELFARRRRPGWLAWGDEAPSSDPVFGAEIGARWPVPEQLELEPVEAPERATRDLFELQEEDEHGEG